MKYNEKDIQKMLTSEVDKVKPDVYVRSKAAPIRGLLSGETPEQAFRARMATWLLICTLAVFLVLTVSLIGYFSNSNVTETVSSDYIGVTVTSGDSVKKIGIIANTDGEVVFALDEDTLTRLTAADGAKVEDALSLLIAPAAGDTVYVSVQNDSATAARAACEKQIVALGALYSGKEYVLNYDVNNSCDRNELKVFIKKSANKVSVNTANTVKELVEQYEMLGD